MALDARHRTPFQAPQGDDALPPLDLPAAANSGVLGVIAMPT
jgi:hypothetical protein